MTSGEMTHYRTDDVRIEQGDELLAPMQVMRELAATPRSERATFEARGAIHDILRGADDRLLAIVGPCSIHDTNAALEYATRVDMCGGVHSWRRDVACGCSGGRAGGGD